MRERRGAHGAKVVALGGGHGLYASLRALRLLTRNLTAVVTVADDGGSSGRLREEFDILPPGDLRMALSALCDDGEWGLTWRDVLQYRFASDGPLNGHSLGNLLLTGVWDLLGDSVEGLDLVGRLLDTKGRVVPMAATPLRIEADVLDGTQTRRVVGQVAVASSDNEISKVYVFPENPPAFPQALSAVHEADWVIFGPGSWYTSVIPHLLVPQLHEALRNTAARRALVINLVRDSETKGLSPADHIRSFHEHSPDLRLDAIIVDEDSVTDWEDLSHAASECGATIHSASVRSRHNEACHDSLHLAAVFRELLDS
ncbi:gluconeogenesis factor YvcK family protein [Trueperella sp. LYQ143]|uniref:gluconeogenesis factor YvcK family protein n=1 Tax=unclassified Trueperella TaxID=2630174 RepID=UPI003982EA9A